MDIKEALKGIGDPGINVMFELSMMFEYEEEKKKSFVK